VTHRNEPPYPRSSHRAVRTSVRTAALFLAALLALGVASCASTKKLTDQSESALAQGDVDRAYAKAQAALKKTPDDERARGALAAAAERKMSAMKERVAALASAGDTLSAGSACLGIEAFRSELAEFQVRPADDLEFARSAMSLRHAAARGIVALSDDAMRENRPRDAYHRLESAREMESAYPGLDERVRQAYAQALHRVVILPIENQTQAAGLGGELAETLYREAADRIRQRNFPFTVILPRDEVYAHVSLAQAEHLERDEALDIARELDADLIVTGRLYALSSESTNNTWQGSLYRRVAARDSSGRSVDRYEEFPLEVTGRSRRVKLRYVYEIREAHHGDVLAKSDDEFTAAARVVYSNARADGDFDDYMLASPALKRADARAAENRERAWKEHCGGWKVSDFLESARKGSRRGYQASMRGEFQGDSQSKPVFLGEVPPVDDLAAIAVRGAWEPVVTALRRVER